VKVVTIAPSIITITIKGMKDKNAFFIDIEMQQQVRNSLNCMEVPPWEDRMDVHSKDFPEIWKFKRWRQTNTMADNRRWYWKEKYYMMTPYPLINKDKPMEENTVYINNNSSWTSGYCRDCGYKVIVTQPDIDKHPTADYWWYCSNKKCKHHHPGEHTGDQEQPPWRTKNQL
jgi:hypothetical protein